ncbi:MAG TPA: ABC transporter ATP-binding protein [Methanoregulaceae archaeon]|nr:ABC transporter ATP-binding protein [Methanoregulaceae archaeon]
MCPVIESCSLSKYYGDLAAVNEVSLRVGQGMLFGLLGPNGSGKTTMIRMLTGQIRPSSGSATILGVDVVKNPVAVREKIGIIPEQETPPSFLTAEEYMTFVGKIRKIDDSEERADWWFEFLDFSDKKDVLCKDLSRGTRQKLMFAQAFLHRPVLAMIDEPLINFDPVLQNTVKEFLKNYAKEGGTIFLSTHILEIAEEICSDIAIIHKGRIIHCGPVAEILSRQEHLSEFFLDAVGKGSNV